MLSILDGTEHLKDHGQIAAGATSNGFGISLLINVRVRLGRNRTVLKATRLRCGVEDTGNLRAGARRGLRALSADAAGKLNVFREDGDTLGVDGAQVGVLEETDEVSL
jgi:hypothetical protein